MIVFDKTGTLTRGDLTLSRIGWLGEEQNELLGTVRAIEEKSRHPVGLALARSLDDIAGPSIESVVEVPGAGVTGQAGERRVAVGSLSLFRGDSIPSAPQPRPTETRVWFGYAGEEPAGYIDLGDSLKPEAREMIEECRSRGIETALFSGDAPSTTEAMAKEAGIAEAAGGLRPEEKAERVSALRASGRRILYVGDGFNDAEALAAADVGVALGAGADLALLSAPVVIAKSKLSAIKDFLNVAGRAGRIVRQNFAWAFGYNILLLPVAALGLLQPVYAAALMALSSTTVGVNSARLAGGAKSGKQTAEGWFRNELVRRPT
jgi:Cu2+-exporting ATPase